MAILLMLAGCSYAAAAEHTPRSDFTLVRHSVDANNDGIAEHTRTIHLDQHGQQIAVDNDINGDGVVDHHVGIRRDEFGRAVEITTDINGDGIADSVEWRAYRYSVITVELDQDADGLVDRTRVIRTP